jgi:hypothetical protein
MDHTSTVERSWRNSELVCCLADSDRHLGHIIKTEKWEAYDATALNEASNGFKYLGAFVDPAEARLAVESSLAGVSRKGVMGAAGGFTG